MPLVIVVCLCMSAQAQQVLDTLYANEHINVALVFPDPIKKAVTGHENFVFTYNREKEESLGLLQANEGKTSNLVVVTSDGSLYSFFLSYGKDLRKPHYFIAKEQCIGQEYQLDHKEKSGFQAVDSVSGKQRQYEEFSQNLLGLPLKRQATVRRQGLRFRLEQWVYRDKSMYLVMELRNNSGIAYELDDLWVHHIIGNKKRKASYQEMPLDIRYAHQRPLKVLHGERKRFVLVLPKLVLGHGQRLQLKLLEAMENRTLVLETKQGSP